jgi:hypothetical protein
MFPKISKKLRQKIINDCDTGLVRTISECCLNVAKKKVKLKPNNERKLTKFRKLISVLGAKKFSIQRKKKLLGQSGSGFFLPLLFSILTPVISNLISSNT